MTHSYHQLLHRSIVIITCVLSDLTNGESHTGKPLRYKSEKEPSEASLSLQDFESHPHSDVAQTKMPNVEVTHQDDGGGGPLKGTVDLDLDLDLEVGVTDLQLQVYEVWIYSIIGAVLVGLSGIFPLLVIPLESGPALKHGEPAKKLRLMLSFAVGSLLGDVFLHLLPEVWAQVDRDNHAHHSKIGLWVIAGLLVFMIIEKLLGDENEFEHLQDTCDEVPLKNKNQNAKDLNYTDTATKAYTVSKAQSHNLPQTKKSRRGKKRKQHEFIENTAKLKEQTNGVNHVPSSSSSNNSPADVYEVRDSNIKVSGYLNLMANVVDNFTHGLAVAGSFCVSTKVGLVTTLAILLHEIPHEVGDFAILLRSGFNRWKAAKAQFFTAMGGVVGAVTALTAESTQLAGERTAWILPFTSGGFMYIALVTVVPDLLQEKHGWESLKQVAFICLGVITMMFVTLAFD